jgi:hypothetical protein
MDASQTVRAIMIDINRQGGEPPPSFGEIS